MGLRWGSSEERCKLPPQRGCGRSAAGRQTHSGSARYSCRLRTI